MHTDWVEFLFVLIPGSLRVSSGIHLILGCPLTKLRKPCLVAHLTQGKHHRISKATDLLCALLSPHLPRVAWEHFLQSPTRLLPVLCLPGRIPRAVASINQHLLKSDDVVSCCLDLGAPSISFRINGQPVQGMFENFNTDGLFFPVVSFSAGVK